MTRHRITERKYLSTFLTLVRFNTHVLVCMLHICPFHMENPVATLKGTLKFSLIVFIMILHKMIIQCTLPREGSPATVTWNRSRMTGLFVFIIFFLTLVVRVAIETSKQTWLVRLQVAPGSVLRSVDVATDIALVPGFIG